MRLGFSPATALMLDLDASFRLAAELELDFIELSFDLHEIAPMLQDLSKVNALQQATGISTTVHLSYVDLNLASLVPAARQSAVERTLRGLDYAHSVAAHCAVLHSGRHYLRHPMADDLVANALNASLEALQNPPVPIALENLVLGEDDYLRGPAQLDSLTRRYGLKNCVDFGHAHIEAGTTGQALIGTYLTTLSDNVIHLHLHNNHAEQDEHHATPDGSIDYGLYGEDLKVFTGTICLEVTSEKGVRRSVRHLRQLTGAAS